MYNEGVKVSAQCSAVCAWRHMQQTAVEQNEHFAPPVPCVALGVLHVVTTA